MYAGHRRTTAAPECCCINHNKSPQKNQANSGAAVVLRPLSAHPFAASMESSIWLLWRMFGRSGKDVWQENCQNSFPEFETTVGEVSNPFTSLHACSAKQSGQSTKRPGDSGLMLRRQPAAHSIQPSPTVSYMMTASSHPT